AQRRQRDVAVGIRAGAGRTTRLLRLQGLALEDAGDQLTKLVGRLPERRRRADRLRRGPAEQLLARVVPYLHRTLDVDREDRERRRLHDGPQSALAAT